MLGAEEKIAVLPESWASSLALHFRPSNSTAISKRKIVLFIDTASLLDYCG